MEIPTIILQENARISVGYQENLAEANTKKTIILKGNREGFFALSNSLLYVLASLRDSFLLSDFSFVDSKDGILVEVVINEYKKAKDLENIGELSTQDNKNYKWKVDENNLSVIAGAIQSLGYKNNEVTIDHLHIDSGVSRDGISVYCVVE